MAGFRSKKDMVRVSEIPLEDLSEERPRLKRKSSARAVIQTDDWWIWELVGIAVSVAAIAGIVGLLSYLDDRPQPSWSYTASARKVGDKVIPAVTVAISPNSILSLLSTICRLCVLIPITKGLAQLKWVWFAEQQRALSDFEAFENATRGVTGSLFLVWKLKFRHFAVVGAAATLLAFAFDPFVQNLLSYYNKTVEDTSLLAELPRALEYTFGSIYNGDLDTKMKSAIIGGYSLSPGFDVPEYYCASGNCTWTDTSTLGVCSRCADVSSHLVKKCTVLNYTSSDVTAYSPILMAKIHCTLTLPNGFSLDSSPNPTRNVHANVTVKEQYAPGFAPMVYSNYTEPIALIHSIYANSNDLRAYHKPMDKNTTFYANDCVLVPCVQTYDTTLNSAASSLGSGVTSLFNDKVTNEYDNYDYIEGTMESPKSGAWVRPHSDQLSGQNFHMGWNSMFQMNGYLQSVIPGTVESDTSETTPYFYNTLPVRSSVYRYSLFLQNVFSTDPKTLCGRRTHSGPWESLRFQCAIENVATGITVRIRNAISDPGSITIGPNSATDDETLANFQKSSPLIAYGKTMVSTTYISVTWYWLALPIALWVLAVVMFVGTVWKTRRAGVRTWRTSTLAPLFLGMGIGEEQKREVEQHPMTAEGLQKKAEELQVRLHLTDQDAKLVCG